MADPITSAVTIISEHPQAVAAVASVYGVVKPFLAKILGPGAEEIGEIGRDYIKGKRAQNAAQTLAAADKMLADVGREAQSVPLATLVPLLETASLQEEPTLAAKWAALLANAADPKNVIEITPGFGDMLRQLTPRHAALLDQLFNVVSHPQNHYSEDKRRRVPLDREDTLRASVNLDLIYIQQATAPQTVEVDREARHRFDGAIDNFLRLGILVLAVAPPEKPKSLYPLPTKPERGRGYFTSLGYEFMRACMPPQHQEH